VDFLDEVSVQSAAGKEVGPPKFLSQVNRVSKMMPLRDLYILETIGSVNFIVHIVFIIIELK